MTEVTPNLPHLGNFCKYCFMGTLLWGTPCLTYRVWIFAGCVRVGAPCFCLCLFLQNPHCVQNSDDRDTHITEHGFPHTGHAECAQNKEHALDAKSNHDVLHHNPFRSLCNINGFYKFRWFICHQNNIRSFNRGIRAKTSHGNADICTGKNRGIVDAIAHEGEFAALPFLLIQHFQLFDLLVGKSCA